jgi:phosphoribosylanthranilate isomerase
VTTLIKICGLTDSVAVQAAVDAGANAVGFVFADSPRRVTPQHAANISAIVPQQIKRVAVMLHPANDEWAEVAEVFQPDVLQTDAADFASLDVAANIERWPVFREGVATTAAALPQMFVYEGQKSGRGEKVDWTVAASLAKRGRMILAGGLSADNVATAIRKVKPFGVDVSSAVESQPGKKDPAMIQAFIAAARISDSSNEESTA